MLSNKATMKSRGGCPVPETPCETVCAAGVPQLGQIAAVAISPLPQPEQNFCAEELDMLTSLAEGGPERQGHCS